MAKLGIVVAAGLLSRVGRRGRRAAEEEAAALVSAESLVTLEEQVGRNNRSINQPKTKPVIFYLGRTV